GVYLHIGRGTRRAGDVNRPGGYAAGSRRAGVHRELNNAAIVYIFRGCEQQRAEIAQIYPITIDVLSGSIDASQRGGARSEDYQMSGCSTAGRCVDAGG